MIPKSKLIFACISGIICLVVGSCTPIGNSGRKVLSEYQYLFEPNLILQSIAKGEIQIFSPVETDSQIGEVSSQPVIWSESDYLTIADAFHKSVWKESVNDWILNSMSFSLLCDQAGKGFQSASFSYIKNDTTDNKDSVIEHQIDIYPNKKLINAWEFLYDSSSFGKSSILTATKLTPANVLEIAEENGGLEKRTQINNKCEISIILSKNPRGNLEWTVLYSPEIFWLTVDPISGRPSK